MSALQPTGLRHCQAWHGWRWLGVASILLLILAAVAIREAEHASQVQHMARGLFSSITPRQRLKGLPAVRGEARVGRTPAEEKLWMQLHDMYVREIEEYKERGEALDLVFLGDSITESLRGTQMGTRIEKFYGIPEVAQAHYGHLKMAAYSLAGDTTLNLLWRLQNGESPAALSPKVAVVLIGTNDITNPLYNLDIQDTEATSAVVAAGIFASVTLLLEQCATVHVILLAVMPRGERYLFVTSTEKYKQPSRYSPVIAAINHRMQEFSEGNQRVTYVDCNDLLLESSGQTGTEGRRINKELMLDALHPNALGQDRLLSCLDSHLQPFLPFQSAASRQQQDVGAAALEAAAGGV